METNFGIEEVNGVALNRYQVHIDFAKNWNQKNIRVETIIIEAQSANHANEIANDVVTKMIEEKELPNLLFYVWEILEDDIL